MGGKREKHVDGLRPFGFSHMVHVVAQVSGQGPAVQNLMASYITLQKKDADDSGKCGD